MSKRKPARTIKARSASKIRSKAAGSGQPKGRANSKQARVLALLCGPNGATIATVTRSTGWQPHTVRAFLAAVVRKKLGLRLASEKTDGERVYRIVAARLPAMPRVCRVRSHAWALDKPGRDRGRDCSFALACA
jgi:hypothetical protein